MLCESGRANAYYVSLHLRASSGENTYYILVHGHSLSMSLPRNLRLQLHQYEDSHIISHSKQGIWIAKVGTINNYTGTTGVN